MIVFFLTPINIVLRSILIVRYLWYNRYYIWCNCWFQYFHIPSFLGFVVVVFDEKFDLSITFCCYLLWFIVAIVYLSVPLLVAVEVLSSLLLLLLLLLIILPLFIHFLKYVFSYPTVIINVTIFGYPLNGKDKEYGFLRKWLLELHLDVRFVVTSQQFYNYRLKL